MRADTQNWELTHRDGTTPRASEWADSHAGPGGKVLPSLLPVCGHSEVNCEVISFTSLSEHTEMKCWATHSDFYQKCFQLLFKAREINAELGSFHQAYLLYMLTWPQNLCIPLIVVNAL